MERLSVSERSELWNLWEVGESQRSISRRLGRVIGQSLHHPKCGIGPAAFGPRLACALTEVL